MAGFNVGGIGAGRPSDIKPIYNYTWDVYSLFQDPKNTLKILAKDATLPTFTVGKETIDGSSLVYKYAGMVTWEDIRITFYDTGTMSSNSESSRYTPTELASMGGIEPGMEDPNATKTSTIIQKWRSDVWSSERGLRSPNDYKNDSIITIYDFNWAFSHSWTLHGSWPSVVKEGDLTYTSTDVKIIEVTISYDWAELKQTPP